MKGIYAVISVLVLLLPGGCTQYNGHIGPIFGSWALVGITQDGVELEMEDETVLSFQNAVVHVVKLDNPPYSEINRYGNFTLSDDVLTFKFAAEPTPSGSHMYMTPDWLYFPLDGRPIELDVKKLKGSEMVLVLHSADGIFEYSFKKTW